VDTGELYQLFMGEGDTQRVVAFLRWLVGEGPARVLDVGAGTGRLLAPLEALGWDVVGLEPRASYRAQHGKIRPGGFADIDEDAIFDAIVAVNDPFAYLLTAAERRDALDRCHRALRPGGVLFLDLPNFLWILKNLRAPAPIEKSGVRRVPSHEIDVHRAVWSHVDRFEIAADGSVVVDRHDFAILTLPHVEEQVAAAGFAGVETFRSYASRASEALDGPRMLVAARKRE
jgi:SAM-dependent methyltransferase